jgi:hypothetical protein
MSYESRPLAPRFLTQLQFFQRLYDFRTGGKSANIFPAALLIFFVFFSGVSERVSVAELLHTNVHTLARSFPPGLERAC